MKTTDKYTTIISDYSLAAGQVGEPIGAPVITEFVGGVAALNALSVELSTPYPSGQGRRFFIGTPDGRELPFDAAYTEIFGESPRYRDNRPTLYPRL